MAVRVITVSRFGGPEVLVPGRAPDPEPGTGQVVVRVSAADVMFVDTMIRSGLGVDYFPVRPPYVPGNGVAGRVIRTGDGVDPGWTGREVVAHTGGRGGSEPAWTERVREITAGRGPDVVFDGAGGRLGSAAFGITASGGRFSAHGISDGGFAATGPGEAARRGVTVHGIDAASLSPADLRRLTAQALSAAAAGRIRPVIGQSFPLDQAAGAHAALAARSAIGKTLLLT